MRYCVHVVLLNENLLIVGTDIEIKFKPDNLKEHVKESVSEENNIFASPVETSSSPQCVQVLYIYIYILIKSYLCIILYKYIKHIMLNIIF